VVWNKADLPWPQARDGLKLSLKTGEGLDGLIAALTGKVAQKLETPTEAPPVTRARHRHALEEAAAALARANSAIEPELMAEDMRLAMRAIGRITGTVDVEDLLDVIFRDFCIGK
jgi:tRNA modification GTPase